MRENPVQQRATLRIAAHGGIPQRNNVGVADRDGTPVRFGLMNTSSKENRTWKSSDIISPIPIVIQQHHVGRTFGVYSAFECKHTDWTFRPSDERAAAQLRYIELMRGVGCIAGFVSDPAHVDWYVREFLDRAV